MAEVPQTPQESEPTPASAWIGATRWELSGQADDGPDELRTAAAGLGERSLGERATVQFRQGVTPSIALTDRVSGIAGECFVPTNGTLETLRNGGFVLAVWRETSAIEVALMPLLELDGMPQRATDAGSETWEIGSVARAFVDEFIAASPDIERLVHALLRSRSARALEQVLAMVWLARTERSSAQDAMLAARGEDAGTLDWAAIRSRRLGPARVGAALEAVDRQQLSVHGSLRAAEIASLVHAALHAPAESRGSWLGVSLAARADLEGLRLVLNGSTRDADVLASALGACDAAVARYLTGHAGRVTAVLDASLVVPDDALDPEGWWLSLLDDAERR